MADQSLSVRKESIQFIIFDKKVNDGIIFLKVAFKLEVGTYNTIIMPAFVNLDISLLLLSFSTFER